ncbi:MAG TPA: hypothetical protein VGO16_02625 [Pseudonocardiaceae bacterium]|jgi:hypothetical protein|nr:hypothetical protein [Pseudonocardiaceae bacterium]
MKHSTHDSATDRLQTRISAPSPALRDVQPILERRPDSIWARVEQARDGICDALRQACENEGFDALVVKSPPFEQPAWVKLECWIPKDPELGRAVTERGSLLVTIVAKEFHRYELEYSVKLHDRGWSKTYPRLGRFDPTHVDQIVRFLLLRGPAPKLADVQLRVSSLEIWKPANKVNVLGTDWFALTPAALIVLGILFLPSLPLLGLVFLAGAGLAFYLLRRRRAVVLSPGKPMAEPRTLGLVDSWQAVISGLGADTELLRERFFAVLRDPPMAGLQSRVEAIWYWGLDGKVEREQIVLTFRRAILFCQIYEYDQELYVGWDAHLNRGQWVEKTVGTGIHKESGEFTRVNTVESGWQQLTEYDVTDVNCLTEWTHAKLVQLVKRLMEERKIDQEIDFKILRGERQNLTTSEQAGEGIQQAARRVTRKLVRME